MGKIIIYVTLALAIATMITYIVSFFKKEKYSNIGSLLYSLTSAGYVGASIYLLANILAHNFSFTYIWEYSSKELTDPLLVATFYSGQQGSFMLWGLMLVVIGIFLIPSSRKVGYESLVMAIYSLVIIFILIMMVAKSPFEMIWETFADQGLEVGFKPENGRGLNPILQNSWITIHPPILFLGYSAMTVPFVFALAGMIKKEYHKWINIAMPWTLFATGVLGFGIMLGGFWAYETLGWGGFWGWDPVENSSLLPWLVGVAFVHTILVQKKTGGLVKTNVILGSLIFVLVLYATFLTRSGILGDTSVHSFVTPGKFIYAMLLLFIILFGLMAIAVVAWRAKDINRNLKKRVLHASSKEFALAFGSIIILASTTIIFLGTSWPWIAELFGKPKAAVDIQIYNDWNLPIAVGILIVNALSLYMRWKKDRYADIFKRSMFSIIFSVVATAIFFFIGVKDFKYIILTFASFFSLFTNIEYLLKNIKGNSKLTGAYLSHFGISLLILGVIASGGYSIKRNFALEEGESAIAFGYKFTFDGKERIEKDKADREKYKYRVKITEEIETSSASIVTPIIYWSNFNDWQQPFLEPGIKTYVTRDIYVSPISVDTDFNIPMVSFNKGQEDYVPIDSTVKMELQGYTMSQDPSLRQDQVVMGAIFDFKTQERSYQDTVYTILNTDSWAGNPIFYTIEEVGIDVGFIQIMRSQGDIADSRSVFIFNPTGQELPEPTETFSFEVTIKPFINLVWIGTIAIAVGFFTAIAKYRRKDRSDNKNIAEE